jgi:hypothetical protein
MANGNYLGLLTGTDGCGCRANPWTGGRFRAINPPVHNNREHAHA